MRSLFALAAAAVAGASPLWDYVHKPDSTYSWFNTGVVLDKQANWKGYLLNMTSQSWLGPELVDRYVWTHQIMVVVPDTMSYWDTAALYITGNGNDNPGVPSNTDEDVLVCAALATESGTPCATLFQVPNEPIVFVEDPLQKRRSEDAIVAFTWAEYMLNHTDMPEYIAYFPMTKAAVRAMDTITAFLPSVLGPQSDVQKYVVAGASKRGATTWFTAAVDDRVIGAVPIVFDILNFTSGIEAMYRTLGGWTFAFTDYYEMNITKYVGTPQLAFLAQQVDPLNYAENLTMPKLVVDATGDEFFQVQDDQFWWGKLPGETLRVMVDNAEHSMATGALYLITSAQAWYQSLLKGTSRPTFDWTIDDVTGYITVRTYGVQPERVVLRSVTTVDGNVRRDFRLVGGNTPANPCKFIPLDLFGSACLKPLIWLGNDVGPTSYNATTQTGIYELVAPLPKEGWRGVLGELYYKGPEGTNTTFQLTTQVSVIPNTYPFPPCVGEECIGVLV